MPDLVTERMLELMDRSTASWKLLGASLAAIAAGSTQDEWQPAHAALGEIVSAETGSFVRLGAKAAVPG